MLLNSGVDNINISKLSKLIGVTRISVYTTIDRLSLGGEGNILLKLILSCNRMTPITLP